MPDRILIAGSRDYPDYGAVRAFIRSLPSGTVVVSGGARGVDSIAEYNARRAGLTVEVYHPDWKTLGNRAGYVRNAQMVNVADRVVCFWDRQSKGTKHTIDLAREKNRPLLVIGPDRKILTRIGEWENDGRIAASSQV